MNHQHSFLQRTNRRGPPMKSAIILTLFLVFNASGALAQVDAKQSKDKASAGDFPSRADAKKNWDKDNPPPTKERGPDTSRTPGGGGGQLITGAALPNPKIDASDAAVDAAIGEIAPMSPAEIRRFADEIYRRNLEGAKNPGGPVEVNGVRLVNLSFAPGTKPEVIRLGLGMGVALHFIDRLGAPILVESFKIFSGVAEGSLPVKEAVRSAILNLEAKNITGSSNVIVRLEGVSNPIVLRIDIGKRRDDGKTIEIDSVVQVVVPVNTSAKLLPGERAEADSGLFKEEMQGFLAGIPPEGAVEVPVKKIGGVSAWLLGGKLYVKTSHTVFSPGFFRRQASADGTAVYEMPLTTFARLGVYGKEVEVLFDYPFIPNIQSTKGVR